MDGEIKVSEIFAQICSFEYADHHDLIDLAKRDRKISFFNRPNPEFYTKPCPGPGTEWNRSLAKVTPIVWFISRGDAPSVSHVISSVTDNDDKFRRDFRF